MTSTSAEYCYALPIIDFIELYETLCEEAKRMKKEAGVGGHN